MSFSVSAPLPSPVFLEQAQITPARLSSQDRLQVRLAEPRPYVQVLPLSGTQPRHGAVVTRNKNVRAIPGFCDDRRELPLKLLD